MIKGKFSKMLPKVVSMLTAILMTVSIAPLNSVTVNRVSAAENAQKEYFVAPTGDDSNAGTKDSPFKTISKASSVVKAGDTCTIRGGAYHESIVPANSGTAGAPITYKSYPGETVTVSGCDLVTGWKLDSGNIYKATMNWDMGDENQVFANGEMMRLAQFPNWTNDSDIFDVGWASMDNGTATSITDAKLNKPDNYWVGATVIVRGWWSTQSAKVTSSKGSTINFDKLPWSDYYTNPGKGVKYMICGVRDQLDRQKEWYYDKNTSTLYLWAPNGEDPNKMNVEAKKRKYAFDLTGRSYINIEGLNILGASITTNNASNCTIKGIDAKYVSHTIGLQKAYDIDDTGIDISGNFNTLRDSKIAYSSGNGIVISGNNNNIINNLVHETDYLGTYNTCIGLRGGKQHLVSYNTAYNTGRDVMQLQNIDDCIVEYNDLYNPGKLSNDLGVIYICKEDGGNTEIRYNYLHDMNNEGNGMYFDNSSHNFLFHHNTVWNTPNAWASFYVGGRGDNNLLYDNVCDMSAQANTGDMKYGTRFYNNVVPNGVTGNTSTAKIYNNSTTTPFDKNTYPKAGCNFQTLPNPTFKHSELPEFRNMAKNYGIDNSLEGYTLTGNKNVSYMKSTTDPISQTKGVTRTGWGSISFGSGQNGVEQVVNGLTPNTLYEFSGWAKVAEAETAVLGIKGYGGNDISQSITNTGDGWVRKKVLFTTGPSNTSVTFYMSKTSTGSGYVYGDDFSVVKVEPADAPDVNLIPQSKMTATATSEETIGENNSAAMAIDGNPQTIWHTKWDKSDKLPQSIILDLGDTYNINKVEYLPRQDSGLSGVITKYNLYASTDGQNFTKVGADGIWKMDHLQKTATFSTVSARYVKLEALEAYNGWAAAAEINVYKDGAAAAQKPTVTAGTVNRIDEKNATVKFTSSKAGTYYYEVVEGAAAVPSIDTTGAGVACTTKETTIDLNNLSSSSEKDIYIKVKDEAGNISEALKINIPKSIAVAKLSTVTIATDNTTLESTKTGKLSISGKLENSSDADLSKAKIEYISSNPDIVSVDENGVITAKNAGSADITAKVTLFETVVNSNTITISSVVESSVVDKSNLISKIVQAQDLFNKAVEGDLVGQYKTGSKAVLKAKIDMAMSVVDKKFASASEVESAVTSLIDAIDTFKAQKITITAADKTEISNILDNAIKSGQKEIEIPSNQVNKGSVPLSLDLIQKAQQNKIDIVANIGNAAISIPNGIIDITKYVKDPSNSTLILTKEDVSTDTSKIDGNLKLIGKAFNLTVQIVDENGKKTDIHNFDNNSKVKVKIKLNSEDIKGKDTSKLSAFYYNEAKKLWEEVQGGKFDSDTLTFTFETTHFSKFAIMEKTASPSIDESLPKAGSTDTSLPKTGSAVDLNILLVLAMLAISGGAILLFRKKRID